MPSTIRFVPVLACLASTAWAGPGDFTAVNRNKNNVANPGVEQRHDQMLATMFGGVWAESSSFTGGTNMVTTNANIDNNGDGILTNDLPFTKVIDAYTNGTLIATRLQDRNAGVTELLSGGSGDQHFKDGTTTIKIINKFAGDNSEFGWVDDTGATPVFTSLFNTGSLGTEVQVTLSSDFRLALLDMNTDRLLLSDEKRIDGVDTESEANQAFLNNTINDHGLDQLVVYQITGLGLKTYALFWEDRIQGEIYEDYDYNDAGIILQVIPLPHAAGLAAAGLFGLAVRRRRHA